MQAYCLKCRKKVEMSSPKAIVMKNGRPATNGNCPECGTKIFKIGKAM
jgi:DNA-directed RNA polymerase subunit RPC12/RpoP